MLKRELGLLLSREIKFAAPLVSIRAVDITPDLKQAHVYVSVIGTEPQKKTALQLLEKNRPFLQREVSTRVILKHTPILNFKLDESIERGSRVIALLDELEKN